MKSLILTFLLLLLVQTPLAQNSPTQSDTSDVAVLQSSWRREVWTPVFDDDPFRANDEQAQQQRDQRAIERENNIRAKQGLPQRIPPPPPRRNQRSDITDRPQTPKDTYIYRVKVRNDGAKEIRSLTWVYIFIDRATQAEVARHQYVTKAKIRPGKSRELVSRSATPPTYTLDARRAGKESQDQFSERVAIHRIEYADGTVWQRPAN